ncbi:MAG: hypothetical protein JSR47_17475 [Proteobacteria bacterium]|nr:hypothetical protein [Pseudomonadota bacterium]MBS0548759.1 hypothetical protein [Pseudomonadota bacterium]
MKRRWFLGLGAVAAADIAVWRGTARGAVEVDLAPSPTDFPKVRGRKLRGALEQAYLTVPVTDVPRTHHLLRRTGDEPFRHYESAHLRDTDISKLVAPYLPAGMSFDTAEEILGHAGFSIGKSDSDSKGPIVWAALHRLTSVWPIEHMDVSVWLHPRRPGETTVAKVVARINRFDWQYGLFGSL